MQIINNTNGLFQNIYFQNDFIDKSITNPWKEKQGYTCDNLKLYLVN